MLLNLNGHDLRDMPLIDRREILQAMIPAGGRIQSSEALTGTGAAVSTWSTRPVSKAWFRSGRIPSSYRSIGPATRPPHRATSPLQYAVDGSLKAGLHRLLAIDLAIGVFTMMLRSGDNALPPRRLLRSAHAAPEDRHWPQAIRR